MTMRNFKKLIYDFKKLIYDFLTLRQNTIFRVEDIVSAIVHIGKDVNIKDALSYSLIPSRFQKTYARNQRVDLSDVRDVLIIGLTISSALGSITRYFIFGDQNSPELTMLLLEIGLIVYLLMIPFRFTENYELKKYNRVIR